MNELKTEEALNALYGAFLHLKNEGVEIKVDRINDVVLVSTLNPKINYIICDYLSALGDDGDYGDYAQIKKPSYKVLNHFRRADSFLKMQELSTDTDLKNFFTNENYFALLYYDKHHTPSYAKKKIMEDTFDRFLREFREKYGKEKEENLWAIRTDWITTKGISIKENITQLIFTLYFRNRGFFVEGDIGKMMDMMVFDSHLLEKLRNKKLIENGTTPVELLLYIPFGGTEKAKEMEKNNKYKFLAIEVENYYSLKEGIDQLRRWIRPHKLQEIFGKYAQPFERAVVAIPVCNTDTEDVDILTYDENGINHIECRGENIAQKVINQEITDEYLEKLIKNTLYDFLPSKYFMGIIEDSLIGNLPKNITEEIYKMSIDKILDIFLETYKRL